MRIRLFLVLCFFIVSLFANGQGKYAGTKKSLLGTLYTDNRNIPGLKSWTFMEGALLNEITDPEFIIADVFKRGSTYLVIISIREDTASDKHEIYDVVEIKGVLKGWTVRTGTCRQNKQSNSYIIAWGKESGDEYMKLIKRVWKFDPDKRRIILIPVKGIDCENIGC